MRKPADGNSTDDGASPSTSCVVDSLIENETIETVGVNNCVNINSDRIELELDIDANNSINNNNNDDSLITDQFRSDCLQIIDNLAAELEEVVDELPAIAASNEDSDDDDNSGPSWAANDSFNNSLFNDDDDDALTSSKYSDVTSRYDALQSSSSPSTSALCNKNELHVASAPATQYASTRDNNRNHQKAVRKNFSLWIGVTSCVWGLLLLLIKKYAD